MWFKNIRLYRFTKPFELSAEALEEHLKEFPFVPCGKHDLSKYGWVSPLGKHGKMLTHTVGNHIMICLQKQEKILPASVVNEALQEKVDEIEEREGRKIFRKEKLQIKDEVTLALLPKSHTRTTKLYAYLAPKEDLLVINTSSSTKAEELLAYLRNSIESLPVIPPNTKHIPSEIMTLWLQHQEPADNFELGVEAELYNPAEDGNKATFRGQDLYSDEIKANLAAGKQVEKLNVTWKDAISCTVAGDLTISKLKFADMILEKAAEGDPEDAIQAFDQDFAVMTLTLSEFFKSLFAVFGGIQKKI